MQSRFLYCVIGVNRSEEDVLKYNGIKGGAHYFGFASRAIAYLAASERYCPRLVTIAGCLV